MDTNGHECSFQSTEYMEQTDASPQEPTKSEEFGCVYEI